MSTVASFVNSPKEMIGFYIWDKQMTNWWDLFPNHMSTLDK